jgi:hypothetical protein
MNHSKNTLILFLILHAGCLSGDHSKIPEQINNLDNLTVYPADAEPVYSITLEREKSFGDTDEVHFGIISSIAVDIHDRVYIADFDVNKVYIFLPGGSYLANAGQTGRGPGETLQTVKIMIRTNRLYVYDHSQRLIHVYTLPAAGAQTAPEFSHTIHLTGEHWNRVSEPDFLSPSLHSVRSDGSFLVNARTSPQIYRNDPDARGMIRYHLLDREGENVSGIIFEQRMPGHIITEWFIIPPPFYGRGLMAVSGNDRIFSAWSDEFLIKVHDPDGEYLRSFYWPVERKTLNREDAINSVEEIEQLQNAIRDMALPETWPAIEDMLIDDENRLWVSTIVEDFDIYEWWVLEETGELITRFEWPRDEPIEVVRNGYMYTRQTDEDTGLQQVVRYRIELN